MKLYVCEFRHVCPCFTVCCVCLCIAFCVVCLSANGSVFAKSVHTHIHRFECVCVCVFAKSADVFYCDLHEFICVCL